MAKPPKNPKPDDIETVPDAWERFERGIDKIAKSKLQKGDLKRPKKKTLRK